MKIYPYRSCSRNLCNGVHAKRVILITSTHLPQKLDIHDILLILLSFSFKIGLTLNRKIELRKCKTYNRMNFYFLVVSQFSLQDNSLLN